MKNRLNRRQFFSLNVEATVGFLGDLLAPHLEFEREFFRPPGTTSELDFLTTCSRCGKCKDSCPEGIIKLFSIHHGAKLVNTPYLDPNEKPCTFCDKCIDTCPTNALDHQHQKSIGYAKVNEKSCIAFKDVVCDYCVFACPINDAIRIVNGKPVISSKNCNGCGFCVASCITDLKGIYILPL